MAGKVVARPLTGLNIANTPSKANILVHAHNTPIQIGFASRMDSYVQPIGSNVGTPTCKCATTRIADNPHVVKECGVILDNHTSVVCTKGHNNIRTQQLPGGRRNAC